MDAPIPLSNADIRELERILKLHAASGGLTLSGFDGLACAVAIGPKAISPVAWLGETYSTDVPW